MAEFPDLGSHCCFERCNLLDFLPMKCDACSETFCKDHISYEQHHCSSSYKKNVQVAICPLCDQPVPGKRDEPADVRVGAHMDNDCTSSRRRVYRNSCSVDRCQKRELVPVTCSDCRLNYCLRHRHPVDHDCAVVRNRQKAQPGVAAVQRLKQKQAKQQVQKMTVPAPSIASNVQGSLTEDEALARAMQLSMSSPAAAVSGSTSTQSQEELDRRLAEELQINEYNDSSTPAPHQSASSSSRNTQQRSAKEKCVMA